MKKFSIASVVATGFAAALFGLAAPANAGIDHHQWIDSIRAAGHRRLGQLDRGQRPLIQPQTRGAPGNGCPSRFAVPSREMHGL